MDINDLRSLITVALFLCFTCIVGWCYLRKNKEPLQKLGNIPFDDGDSHQRTLNSFNNQSSASHER